ncbi:MAG: ATPase, partial [Planctomycetota bacterium]
MSASSGRELIGQILKRNKAVREGQIQEALEEQKKHGGLIGQSLVAMGSCAETDIVKALAEQAGMEAVDLNSVTPEPEALSRVDPST